MSLRCQFHHGHALLSLLRDCSVKNFIAIILSLLVIACGYPAPESAARSPEPGTHGTSATVDETGRINAWFDEQYEEQLMFSPISLTALGRK